jgi:hypothetical protein
MYELYNTYGNIQHATIIYSYAKTTETTQYSPTFFSVSLDFESCICTPPEERKIQIYVKTYPFPYNST